MLMVKRTPDEAYYKIKAWRVMLIVRRALDEDYYNQVRLKILTEVLMVKFQFHGLQISYRLR